MIYTLVHTLIQQSLAATVNSRQRRLLKKEIQDKSTDMPEKQRGSNKYCGNRDCGRII
jgi:hypothetical protein